MAGKILMSFNRYLKLHIFLWNKKGGLLFINPENVSAGKKPKLLDQCGMSRLMGWSVCMTHITTNVLVLHAPWNLKDRLPISCKLHVR